MLKKGDKVAVYCVEGFQAVRRLAVVEGTFGDSTQVHYENSGRWNAYEVVHAKQCRKLRKKKRGKRRSKRQSNYGAVRKSQHDGNSDFQ